MGGRPVPPEGPAESRFRPKLLGWKHSGFSNEHGTRIQDQTTRDSIYQAVAPQGSQVPGLAQSMLVGFIVTDLLFIFSAVVNSLPQ